MAGYHRASNLYKKLSLKNCILIMEASISLEISAYQILKIVVG